MITSTHRFFACIPIYADPYHSVSVKEAIIPTGTASGTTERDFDLKKLKEVLDRCGVVITERKPSTYASALEQRYC